MLRKAVRVIWISVVFWNVCRTILNFPLLLVNLGERVGAGSHIWITTPRLLLIQSLLFLFGRNPLSCCNNTPQAKTAAPYIHVDFFSTSHTPPQSFFIITSGWDGHAMSRRVPPRRPKNRFPPQQGCPGDPSAPGGGRAQHVSLNPQPTSCGTQNLHSSVNHGTWAPRVQSSDRGVKGRVKYSRRELNGEIQLEPPMMVKP